MHPGEQARPQTLSSDVELHLPEFDTPPDDPIKLLSRWLELADEHEVREPRALALATADEDGFASSRIVLLKEVDPALVFTSHHFSRKGRDLAAVPWAAGTLYWRETGQQVNVAGKVQRLTDEESDALFAARPLAAQATTIASSQSEPLTDAEELRIAAERLMDGGGPLDRPDNWGGYRLLPESIEFWHGSPDRLHRRLLYRKAEIGWAHQRLQP